MQLYGWRMTSCESIPTGLCEFRKFCIQTDQFDVRRAERYVTLKILKAELSETAHELKIHQFLSKVGGYRASVSIVQMLDYFYHDGPNGTHLCLVFEALGVNVHDEDDRPVQMPELQVRQRTVE